MGQLAQHIATFTIVMCGRYWGFMIWLLTIWTGRPNCPQSYFMRFENNVKKAMTALKFPYGTKIPDIGLERGWSVGSRPKPRQLFTWFLLTTLFTIGETWCLLPFYGISSGSLPNYEESIKIKKSKNGWQLPPLRKRGGFFYTFTIQ